MYVFISVSMYVCMNVMMYVYKCDRWCFSGCIAEWVYSVI